jgi:hypothetical protein
VFCQGKYAGAIISRGRWGFETIDPNETAIGIYASQREAVSVLQALARKG